MEVDPEDFSSSLFSILEARLSVVMAENDARKGKADLRDSVKDISLRLKLAFPRKKLT